ncbi:hypothetical protein [Demequina sp.]|uniref:hypothetical protein n=1 Tax=Demequina sp. TaxID=2050685 RepID=UPI0025D5111B|nr:hypothetical protein [Demequina sp.]
MDTTETVLATGTADVDADGTAVVTLAVPVDASGRASVELDDVSLGTLTITE